MRKWFVLVISLTLSGCTSIYQVRGIAEPLNTPIKIDDLGDQNNDKARRMLDARSIESFKLEADDLNGASPDSVVKGYDIGIVEFNDEGWGNRAQQDQVFKLIDKVNGDAHANGTAGPLIVTFIHGWHHNPQVCDGNLACFRRVMKTLAIYESRKPVAQQKPVLGIFVGWRGDSAENVAGKILSFYGRKNTAEHIGKTGGKDFLLDLETVVNGLKKSWAEPISPTMITVGHSFGGALLFSAIQGKLIGSVDGTKYVRSAEDLREIKATKPLKTTFGDLAILLNPAIEAYQYVPFDEEVKDRSKKYSPNQLPVLITMASKADTAVGWLFPIGYTVKALFEPWELDHPFTKSRGIGRYKPQLTHILSVNHNSMGAKSANTENNDFCGCSYSYYNLEQNLKAKAIAGDMGFKTNLVTDIAPGIDLAQIEKNINGLTLKPTTNSTDQNSPYLVIGTDKEVINSHNDIYNNRVVGFLVEFFVSYQTQKERISDPGFLRRMIVR